MHRRNDIEAVMCPIPIYGTCSDFDNILTLSCPPYTTDSTKGAGRGFKSSAEYTTALRARSPRHKDDRRWLTRPPAHTTRATTSASSPASTLAPSCPGGRYAWASVWNAAPAPPSKAARRKARCRLLSFRRCSRVHAFRTCC